MYCGYIVELKNLHKHSNADRLQCAEIFGNNVIFDMSYHEGQKVVFFPTDGQLNEDYARKNNLLREKDADGKNTGGYLDPDKRNIRAIKLRGEKSEGLALPIETLSDYVDINILSVGTKITSLGGVCICQKYIPKRQNIKTHTSSNSIKKGKSNHFPLFQEHVDTEQLAYNKDAFKPGDRCTITLKCHGCFVADTRVRIWGKDKGVQIKNVKPGDIVVGYKDGELVPSRVLQTFNNGKANEWREIRITRQGYAGESVGKIICTPEHLFWNNALQTYVKAKDIAPGHSIQTIKRTPLLSNEIKEILLGLYLGDGYLYIRNKVAKIEHGQKEDRIDYLNYIIKVTDDLFHLDRKTYLSGYGTTMRRILSRECTSIKQFFDAILSHDGINKLSDAIFPYFTDLAVAFLYMDDGSLAHNETQQDRASFAICDYNDHDANIISQALARIGYDNTLYKDPKGYNRIRLLTDASQRMFASIEKYIPDVMRYKLPLKYRKKRQDVEYNFKTQDGYAFIENTVLSNKEIHSSRGKAKYDLQTETGNYVVGDVLVHNSSGRSSYSIRKDLIKQNFFQKLFHRPTKETTSWDMVTGSRRCVLEEWEGGYYGDQQFRKKWHDFLSGKLEKGETLYYEIVGWVNPQTTIMPIGDNKRFQDKEIRKLYGDKMIFSYGCDVGENDIYAYRMTLTNEDGYTVEYPDWLMRLRCEMMGVKCVPLFETFTFTTWEDLMERVEKYYDGPDPIGKTHIREGVVVRIENRPKFEAYKHKSFTFKLSEGLIKETAQAPDMEEAEEVGDGAGEG